MTTTSTIHYSGQCYSQQNQNKTVGTTNSSMHIIFTILATILLLDSTSSSLPSLSVEAAFASAATSSITIRGGTTNIPSSLLIKQKNRQIGGINNNNAKQNPTSFNTFRANSAQTTILTKFRGGALSFSPSSPPPIFSNAPLYQSTLLFLLLNTLGLIISVVSNGSHVHLDLLGTGAFAVAALPTLIGGGAGGEIVANTRITISSASVVVWGVKLALFLFWRATKIKRDGRLEDALSTFSGTVIFWFISAVWGILTSLPHTLGTTSSSPGNPIFLTIGSILYLSGLSIETLADYQKWTFKQQNPSSFCNIGLWSISQHPNFFGNLLLWFGIFLMNAPALIGGAGGTSLEDGSSIMEIVKSSWRLPLSCLGPLFLWSLFSSQVNGDMTNAVELAKTKYGNDPGYVEYIENVPKIVPNLFRLLKKK